MNRWPRKFFGKDNGGNGVVWLRIDVFQLGSQPSNARHLISLTNRKKIDSLAFVLPWEFQENIVHSWSEYDSIANRGSQKVSSINKNITDAASTGTSLVESGSLSGEVVKSKHDTPIVYSDSNRREYSLTFVLADEGDPYIDIYAPIDKLRRYSCAQMVDDIHAIEWPHIFRLTTVTGSGMESPLLRTNACALQSVQPSFSGPFRNGMASKCDLTCTFIEIEPLYRRNFDRAGYNRVSTSEK
jgi:hypothetical protein